MRPLVLRISGLFLVVSGISGCEDVQLGWPGEPTQGAIRPAGQPIHTRPAPRLTTRPSTAESDVRADYYQVVLASDQSRPEPAAGVAQVVLHQATARRAGRLVAMLYVPIGQTGSANRFTLIYPTRGEAQLAAIAAARLDVSRRSDPQDPFASTVSSVYGLPESGDDAGMTAVIAGLRKESAGSPGSTGWPQWAAGMIGGGLLLESSHYAEAEQLFAAAEDRAEPGSFEQFMARFQRGRSLALAERSGDARRLLRTVLAEFDRFRPSEAFERVRQMLAELDSRR